MVVKQKIYTPNKMVKGVIDSKQAEGNYFHAKNLRFESHLDNSTGGFVFEKGNDIHLSIPKVTVDYQSTSFKYQVGGQERSLAYKAKGIVYPRCDIEKEFEDQSSTKDNLQIVIGHSVTRDGLLLFSTDNNGFDCIWYVSDSGSKKEVELRYCRRLAFSSENPIQAISNYENQNIDKTYWIDGINQQRSVNIKDKDLVNLKVSILAMVGNFNLSQIDVLDSFSGGNHTAGVVQYAYNLYRVNGSQTKISPLSEAVSLDKGINGGGELNEVVSRTISIGMKKLDTSYENIKVYAVKYTSYNQSPSISVIMDQKIPSNGELGYFDDGSIVTSVSSETFLFLGGEILIPRSMEVKHNRMFLSNYAERSYDLVNKDGINVADGCRAFSYNVLNQSLLADSMKGTEFNQVPASTPLNPDAQSIPSNFSCINPDYSFYRFQKGATVLGPNKPGGTGKFLKYELTRSEIGSDGFTDKDAEGRFYKDGEVYRVSLQFYSKYGEVSTPKWIADFVTEQSSKGNLSGYYGTMKVTLLDEFYEWLETVQEDLRPVGFKLLRAERNAQDKTIVAQGIINGMIATGNKNRDRANDFSQAAKDFCHDGKNIKVPSMIRNFGDVLCPMLGSKTYLSIPGKQHPEGNAVFGKNGAFRNNTSEIYHFRASADARRMSYQFNKLMQFNCPEIEFDLLNSISTNNLSAIGMLKNTSNEWWGKELHVTSKTVVAEARTKNCISPSAKVASQPGNLTEVTNGSNSIQDFGIIGPSGNPEGYDNHQFYREYNNDNNGGFVFKKKDYKVLGKPEVAERGATKSYYKKDSRLSYSNSLEGLGSDTANEVDDIGENGVDRINSWSCKSAFFVLGEDNEDLQNRTSIEDIYSELEIEDPFGLILCEFKTADLLKYVGGIYGGNSYEDKKRTNYIEIGTYSDILDKTLFIKSPGDTFVSNYKFERISKSGVESSENKISHITEIVSYTTETSIDLRRRNDLSVTNWDNKFMPLYENYKKYNRVYSQEPNFISRRDNDYTFQAVKNFETSIISTKQKIPNETIDSWTDILINEQIALDGRYGAVNALVSFRDEIFAVQDRAIARISILPRVQVTGDDGVAVQLGTGTLFNEYKYMTTKSGSVNKWGVIATERGIYYVDSLNKSFMVFSENGVDNLSDREQFHQEFQSLLHEGLLVADNPVLMKGVSMGYDQMTKDVYMSIWKNGACTTIAYGESKKGFTSYYDYDARMYIYNKNEMLTLSPFSGSKMYKNFTGKYNVFYGQQKDSYYSLIMAPEPEVECLFNNIEYNSVSKDSNGLEALKTWEEVRVYNDFQDSGFVKLIDRKNIRKKNRKYRISLPRNKNSRNRIRNTSSILTLKASNIEANRMLMNDIILYYSPNYIVVQ
jgi:hypothetical protein